MKQFFILGAICALLSACAHTHVGVNANNNGVVGAVGSSWRW